MKNLHIFLLPFIELCTFLTLVDNFIYFSDESNNYTEIDDPFYEHHDTKGGCIDLRPQRLTTRNLFDCTLSIEMVRWDEKYSIYHCFTIFMQDPLLSY